MIDSTESPPKSKYTCKMNGYRPIEKRLDDKNACREFVESISPGAVAGRDYTSVATVTFYFLRLHA